MPLADNERKALEAFPTAHGGDADDVAVVLMAHLRDRGIEATTQIMDGTLYVMLPSGARVQPFARETD